MQKKLKGKRKKLNSKEVPIITWGDILQSWELEAKGKINSKIHTDFKADDFLGPDEEEIGIGNAGVKCKRSSPIIP